MVTTSLLTKIAFCKIAISNLWTSPKPHMDKIRDQEIYARQNANISTKTMKGEKNEENNDSEHYIIEIPKIKEFENLCLPLSVITAVLLEKGKILKEKEYIRKGNVF